MATPANLSDLRNEFKARGFDYLPDSRANYMINAAINEILDLEAWPFLEASTAGVPPLTISDLKEVLSVTNTTTSESISYVDRRLLTSTGTVLTTVSSPANWYYEGTQIATYPLTTSSITVRYIKAPTELSSDADVPGIPHRYKEVIVLGAVIRAYMDNDDWQQVAAARQEWDRQVSVMKDSYFKREHDPGYILVTQPHDWKYGGF